MTSPRTGQFIPAEIEFPDGSAGWGRLIELHPGGALLLTRPPVPDGGEIFLSFELEGSRIEKLRSRLAKRRHDPDGYLLCEIFFIEESPRSEMRSIILDMLARDRGTMNDGIKF
ncbi:MAG: hypothetical protein ABIG11_08160 [bacterium]